MFDSLYFSVICVFTVGFGDVVPITSAGRAVSALTVLTSAVLIPLQLSEIISATMQVRMEAMGAKAGGEEAGIGPGITRAKPVARVGNSNGPAVVLFDRQVAVDAMSPDGSLEAIVLVDLTVECTQCLLRGHQRDARFCRNCAGLLNKSAWLNH
jgi:hypothetical protein